MTNDLSQCKVLLKNNLAIVCEIDLFIGQVRFMELNFMLVTVYFNI